MAFNFNPVRDGDWQGINVALEDLSYQIVATPTDKTGTPKAQVTKDEVTQAVSDEVT